jgi:hypothetical protein
LCSALIIRGTTLVFLDRFEEALIHAQASIALSRQHGLSEQEDTALINAADIAMTSDLPEALEYGEASMANSQRRGKRYGETVAASNLMYSLLYAGDWARAESLLAEMLGSGGADRPQVEFLHARAAMLAAWRGDGETAAAALGEMAALRDSDSVDDMASLALTEALIAGVQGHHAEAVRHAGAVIDGMRVHIAVRNESVRPAWVQGLESLFALGDLDAADEWMRRITDLPPGFVPPYLKAEAARFGARLAAARGDDDAANAAFAEAQQQLDSLGYRYWSARCRLDHAEWLAANDRDGAAALASAAGAVFDELAATAWATRARALAPAGAEVHV